MSSGGGRTGEILREILAREVAAKTFYEELLAKIEGTEFERFRDEIQDMVDEEREHEQIVRGLIAKYG